MKKKDLNEYIDNKVKEILKESVSVYNIGEVIGSLSLIKDKNVPVIIKVLTREDSAYVKIDDITFEGSVNNPERVVIVADATYNL